MLSVSIWHGSPSQVFSESIIILYNVYFVLTSKCIQERKSLCPNPAQFLLGDSNLLIRGSPSSLAHLEENREMAPCPSPSSATDKMQDFATVTVPIWVPQFLTCSLKVFKWVTVGNSSD